MMLSKTLHPLIRYYPSRLTSYKILPVAICKRYKTGRENTLTRATRTDVDTNVKPLGEKVKEHTKTASYLGIILLGVGVTGSLIYAVFNELFSSKSPNNIYNKAVKRCLADPRIEDKLGLPITAYGEETRRGRRQHVSHLGFIGNDGRKHLRMRFYLKGSFHKGTVHLEMVEVNKRKIRCKNIFKLYAIFRTRLVIMNTVIYWWRYMICYKILLFWKTIETNIYNNPT